MPHTIYTNDLIETTMDINESLVVLEGLIKHHIDEDGSFEKHFFCLFLELFSLNRALKLFLEKNFEVPVFKDEDQKELVVEKDTLGVMMSLLISRKSIMDELNELSSSVRLN